MVLAYLREGVAMSNADVEDVLAPLGKEVELPVVVKEWKETEYAVYQYTPNR